MCVISGLGLRIWGFGLRGQGSRVLVPGLQVVS